MKRRPVSSQGENSRGDEEAMPRPSTEPSRPLTVSEYNSINIVHDVKPRSNFGPEVRFGSWLCGNSRNCSHFDEFSQFIEFRDRKILNLSASVFCAFGEICDKRLQRTFSHSLGQARKFAGFGTVDRCGPVIPACIGWNPSSHFPGLEPGPRSCATSRRSRLKAGKVQ